MACVMSSCGPFTERRTQFSHCLLRSVGKRNYSSVRTEECVMMVQVDMTR